MDVDAYAAAHRASWERLDALVRARRLDPAGVDELVELYQRTATHLSVVRSTSPDPALVARLSTLVARARAVVVGTPSASWRDAARFVTVSFPVALAATWRWWVPTLVATFGLMLAIGWWVAADPEVQAALVPPDEVRRLVDQDFAAYYSSAPASSFAGRVWTNNALIAAVCLIGGVALVPVVYVMFQNALNVGVAGGIMAANGRLEEFFGLITPHGLLELTALFVAAGAGLRLGWAWVAPGPLTRTASLARQGRITAGTAIGVAGLLLVSGVIEAFVTPSGLPTWARIGIGVLAELAFVAYVVLLGGRRLRAGGTEADADVDADTAGASVPTTG